MVLRGEIEMSKESKGAVSLVIAIICYIIAFITVPASNSFKPTSVTFYANDTYLSQSYTQGQPKMLGISNVVLWVGLITGTILLIYAIYCFVTSKESKVSVDDSSQTPMFIDCPNCGEANTVKNEYCFKCHQRLSNRPLSHTTGNKWYCPNCGKENQSYVGTCGCGTRKL